MFHSQVRKGKKKQSIAIVKLVCLKFSLFELTNININLNAVGYHPRSIFRLLAMLLEVNLTFSGPYMPVKVTGTEERIPTAYCSSSPGM